MPKTSIHSLAKSLVLNLLLVHLCPNYIKIFEFSGWNFFINKMETESQRLLGVLPCSLTQIGVLFIDYYISKDRLISLPLHCLEQSSILLASRGFFHWLFMHEFCFFFSSFFLDGGVIFILPNYWLMWWGGLGVDVIFKQRSTRSKTVFTGRISLVYFPIAKSSQMTLGFKWATFR